MILLTTDTEAPDFTLFDQKGEPQQLSAHRGEWVLLYFYPKDDTPGCTKEACTLRDALPDLSALHAQVFGISTDSIESHKAFAQKYKLPFTLLSDDTKRVVKQYGGTSRRL